MNHWLHSALRAARYALWSANGVVGPRTGPDGPKLCVLIAYYNPARARHIRSQVRNLLKCRFVERVVVTSHNPDLHLEPLLRLRDPRVTVMHSERRHGCGHRWLTAASFDWDYLVVIDDDIRLFSQQLARFHAALVADPEAPHGLSGLVFEGADSFGYWERTERHVDVLCEAYAITRAHLQRYHELAEKLSATPEMPEMIESAADCVVLSHAGTRPPRIHDLGRIFRCKTFNQAGVAVHQEGAFGKRVLQVRAAIDNA